MIDHPAFLRLIRSTYVSCYEQGLREKGVAGTRNESEAIGT